MLNKLIEKLPDESGELKRLHAECTDECLVFSRYCLLALPECAAKTLHQRRIAGDEPTSEEWAEAAHTPALATAQDRMSQAAARKDARATAGWLELEGVTWEEQANYLKEAFKNAK